MPSLAVVCKYCRCETDVPRARLAQALLFRCPECCSITSLTASQCKVLIEQAELRINRTRT
jgi:hypothetical protein